MEVINQGCIDRQFVKKPNCSINTGYKQMSIIDYVKHQTYLGVEYDYTNVDGIDCVKLYRSDTPGKHAIHPKARTVKYVERMKRFFAGEKLINFCENIPFGEKLPEGWGNQPGIGINLTASLAGAITYGGSYADDDGNINISTFYIKLDPAIIVLVVPKECEWEQITCNETVHLTYNLVGHISKTAEINLLVDNGFNSVIKTDSKIYNIGSKLPWVGANIEYRQKYLKYKAKYLALKKFIKYNK